MALTVRTDFTDFLGSTYGITSAEAVIDMRDEIAELDADEGPAVTLLMHPDFGSRQAYSVKIEWLEHEDLPVTTTTDTDDSGTGTATSIVVASGTGAYFRPKDLIKMEATGELISVTSISTDTLTVVRGVGNSGTGTEWGTTNGLIIARVWNASEQGALMPEIRQVNTVALFNYTSIPRVPFGEARSAAMTKRHGGDPEARYRKAALRELKRSMERMVFEGKRDLLTLNSRPRTIAGGVLYYNTANIQTVSGNLTVANARTYMRALFRYGSNRKFAFCSPLAYDAFSYFSDQKMALDSWSEGKKYGISTKVFHSGGNELVLIKKKDWNDRGATATSTASPSLAGSVVILDLDSGYVTHRELMAPKLFENRQARERDGYIHEFIAEHSLEVCHGGSGGSGFGAHGWWRGITGAA